MVTLGQSHPARSPRGSLQGRRNWEVGGGPPGALKGPPRITLSAAPCPPKLVAGTSRHHFVWGCLAQQLCLPSAYPAPFCGTPAQSQSWSPTEEAARTFRSAPSSRVGHTPGDDTITHSAPASSVLPEASRAPYHLDESGPPRAPLPKTCY